MGKSFYTFIIVPNASSRLHKLKLPVRALYLLAGVGILSFFVAVGLGFSYARMAFKAADYDKLQAENTNLKIQKKNLEVATQKLGDKISNLENIIIIAVQKDWRARVRVSLVVFGDHAHDLSLLLRA